MGSNNLFDESNFARLKGDRDSPEAELDQVSYDSIIDIQQPNLPQTAIPMKTRGSAQLESGASIFNPPPKDTNPLSGRQSKSSQKRYKR